MVLLATVEVGFIAVALVAGIGSEAVKSVVSSGAVGVVVLGAVCVSIRFRRLEFSAPLLPVHCVIVCFRHRIQLLCTLRCGLFLFVARCLVVVVVRIEP